MTTLSLPANVRSITLEDGRTFVLDGKVPAATAKNAIASTRNVQTTPAPKRSKGRKVLTGEALAKQVAFWSGPASKNQRARIVAAAKSAGKRITAKRVNELSALEARALLGTLDPSAKLAVIPTEVPAALKA